MNNMRNGKTILVIDGVIDKLVEFLYELVKKQNYE